MTFGSDHVTVNAKTPLWLGVPDNVSVPPDAEYTIPEGSCPLGVMWPVDGIAALIAPA